MNTDISFKLRGVYSFDVYPTALLGTSYKNVTILGIMDPTTAAKKVDIKSLHVMMFPTLPAGSSSNFEDYDYVEIKTSTGETTVLSMGWINPATVTQVTSSTAVATIGGISAADVPRIINALVQNGFNDVTVSLT